VIESDVLDARALANCLLDLADELGIALTITSLLKIVYFCQGWHLATYGRPLVGQPFEAWQHGPVVRVVYDSFKVESKKVIKGRAEKLNPVTAKFERCRYSMSPDRLKFVEAILRSYSKFHPYKLSDMTHEIDSPWHRVWNRTERESDPGMRIPNSMIRSYFLELNNSDLYRG
jgi:uncharacterized phage-associated protein